MVRDCLSKSSIRTRSQHVFNGLCNLLDAKKHLKIISKGTDLSMSIAGRKWVNCAGKLNLPDGEVFTAPIEDIQLTFNKGKVIDAKAKKGKDLLDQLLDTDEGAKYVGETAG
jgi:aminopeptidase